MTRGPLTQAVAQHHTVFSACCGCPQGSHDLVDGEHLAGCLGADLNNTCPVTCHEFEPIKLASGGVAGPDGYLDLRAAMWCEHGDCTEWLDAVDSAVFMAVREAGWKPRPALVATGTLGSAFLTFFSYWHPYKVLWTPRDHGLPCSPFPPPPAGTKVVLVDDVVTTPEPCCEHPRHVHYWRNDLMSPPVLTPECVPCGLQRGHEYHERGTMYRMRDWVESWGGVVVAEIEAASL